jgi:hypothetical protein
LVFSCSSVNVSYVGSDTTCGIKFDLQDNGDRSEERNVIIESTDAQCGWEYIWYSPKNNLYFVGYNDWSEKRAALNKTIDEKGYAKIKAYFKLIWWHNTCWTPEITVKRGDVITIITDSYSSFWSWSKKNKAKMNVYKNNLQIAHVES